MVIQLTKKCNLNCFYCDCHSDDSEVLSQESVIEMVKHAVLQGEASFDLSDGEPLLYPDIEILIDKIKQIEGVEKVTISTNGILLPKKLEILKAAGLDGVSIHMDTSDAWEYAKITGAEMVLNDVLSGMWLAYAKDIPLTVNVALHEKSRDALIVIAAFAKKMDINIRFVNCGRYTEEAGLSEEKVVKKLSRHFKDLTMCAEHVYSSSELKGKIIFADQMTETFA